VPALPQPGDFATIFDASVGKSEKGLVLSCKTEGIDVATEGKASMSVCTDGGLRLPSSTKLLTQASAPHLASDSRFQLKFPSTDEKLAKSLVGRRVLLTVDSLSSNNKPKVVRLPVDSPCLPSGWSAHVNDKDGRTFFHHSLTRTSQWHFPREDEPAKDQAKDRKRFPNFIFCCVDEDGVAYRKNPGDFDSRNDTVEGILHKQTFEGSIVEEYPTWIQVHHATGILYVPRIKNKRVLVERRVPPPPVEPDADATATVTATATATKATKAGGSIPVYSLNSDGSDDAFFCLPEGVALVDSGLSLSWDKCVWQAGTVVKRDTSSDRFQYTVRMENNDNGSGLYSEEVRFDFRRMQWCLLGATPSAVTMHLYNDPTENSLGKPGVGIEKGARVVLAKNLGSKNGLNTGEEAKVSYGPDCDQDYKVTRISDNAQLAYFKKSNLQLIKKDSSSPEEQRDKRPEFEVVHSEARPARRSRWLFAKDAESAAVLRAATVALQRMARGLWVRAVVLPARVQTLKNEHLRDCFGRVPSPSRQAPVVFLQRLWRGRQARWTSLPLQRQKLREAVVEERKNELEKAVQAHRAVVAAQCRQLLSKLPKAAVDQLNFDALVDLKLDLEYNVVGLQVVKDWCEHHVKECLSYLAAGNIRNETRHFLISGAIGTGKALAAELIAKALYATGHAKAPEIQTRLGAGNVLHFATKESGEVREGDLREYGGVSIVSCRNKRMLAQKTGGFVVFIKREPIRIHLSTLTPTELAVISLRRMAREQAIPRSVTVELVQEMIEHKWSDGERQHRGIYLVADVLCHIRAAQMRSVGRTVLRQQAKWCGDDDDGGDDDASVASSSNSEDGRDDTYVRTKIKKGVVTGAVILPEFLGLPPAVLRAEAQRLKKERADGTKQQQQQQQQQDEEEETSASARLQADEDAAAAMVSKFIEKSLQLSIVAISDYSDSLIALLFWTGRWIDAYCLSSYYVVAWQPSTFTASNVHNFSFGDYMYYRTSFIRRTKAAQAAARAAVDLEIEQLTGMGVAKRWFDDMRGKITYVENGGNAKVVADICLNMSLTGNPGTGKTTLARLMFKFLRAYGVLKKDVFIEMNALDLKGKYVGWTAPLVQNTIRSAMGGALFLDEAYALAGNGAGKQGDSFSGEAIRTLLTELENNRTSVMVIVAGYRDKMATFFRADPGLPRRFPTQLHLADYTAEELTSIAVSRAASFYDMTIAAGVEDKLTHALRTRWASDTKGSNGGFAVKLVEDAVGRLASRVSKQAIAAARRKKQKQQQQQQQQQQLGGAKKGDDGPEEEILDTVLLDSDFDVEDRLDTSTAGDAEKKRRGVDEEEEESEAQCAARERKEARRQALAELGKMVGMKPAKAFVRKLLLKVKLVERGANRALLDTCTNLVLTGNPGVGKTTFARVLHKILHTHGVVREDTFVERNALELKGQFIGQTAPKVQDAMAAAKGGSLFLDEFPALGAAGCDGRRDSFANDAIRTLLTEIENNRNGTVVILAGYEQPMEVALDADPGLRRRFPHRLHLPDYTPPLLAKIGADYALSRFGLSLGEGVEHFLASEIATKHRADMPRQNASLPIRLVELALERMAERVVGHEDDEADEADIGDIDDGGIGDECDENGVLGGRISSSSSSSSVSDDGDDTDNEQQSLDSSLDSLSEGAAPPEKAVKKSTPSPHKAKHHAEPFANVLEREDFVEA
jgi:SpoVK/Ycf46/Vps4 family AAA+-type ATPase/DNA polymerase III delta prime subunit